jgi:hypothetical protein
MKRVAQFLMRLYPANWRARYGDEFEALIEDSSLGWRGIVDLVKGAIRMQLSVPVFPKLALMLSVAGLAAGLAVSFVVDPRFVSTGAMSLGDSLVQYAPSTVRPNLREYFAQMKTEILSRTSLSIIIQDPRLELYMSERARIPLEDVIEKMRQDIQITTEAPGSNYLPFRVTFTYADRARAQQTVMALMTRLEDDNLILQRARGSVERVRTSNQVYLLESRVAALEKRLGIPSPAHEPDFPPAPTGGIDLAVVDPPSLPATPVYPDRIRFMATGFGAGIALAILIAVFRRRPPPIPFPAQTA